MDDEQSRRIYELRCELSRNAIQSDHEIRKLHNKVNNLRCWLAATGGCLVYLLLLHHHYL